MTAELALVKPSAAAPDLNAIERVLVAGDLSKLTPDQRLSYYQEVCRSLGLNPLTRPFEYITLSGRLVLYAKKDCTDQLRKTHSVSVDVVARERIDDLYVVTARATTREGRHDEEIGAVTIGNLRGDSLANALMKATTKAKRRVTLSICGLGMLDETEIETIEGAVVPTQLPASPQGERPATGEERAKFDAGWKKGTARAVACGVAPDDAPPPNSPNSVLNRAGKALLEAIQARERLNTVLVERVNLANQHGGDLKTVEDPSTLTDQEVHEAIATADRVLEAAEQHDEDDAAF